jgi:lysyl endopeptidase
VQGADTAFEISGRAILETIQRNRDAGEVGDAGRTYWTPPVDSQEVTLEIELPAGTSTDAVDISVPRLSHLQFKSEDIAGAKIGEAQTCEVDVSCISDAGALSAGTARMLFTDAGFSYLCTGTLLNDSSSSGTPYFLSANHCISSQTAASSLSTYWFYRSTACNTGVLNGGYRVLHSGAALLYASGATDTAFMRLNEPAPAGAVFAGWSMDVPSVGADVVGVHHPLGDLQKFNRGTLSGFGSCNPGVSETFSCVNATPATGKFLFSNWNLGTTEPGSSGAGLFAAVGTSRYLIGQLYGGSASCTFRNGSDSYGRFDIAYFAALSRWLSAPAATPRTAIYRFYNAGTGAHFYTASAAERDLVISVNPAFRFEGVAFYGYGSQVSGASPVYRFYNVRNGRHFFTISPVERDIVLSTLPDFSFEGIGWYAQAAVGGTAAAVYRFYNDGLATHFYTISEGERDWVLGNLPGYRLEGVGYYAWVTQ